MPTKPRPSPAGGLVYSTDHGAMCPGCCRPLTGCICTRDHPAASRDGIVRVGRETKGRKGSGVSVVTGLPMNPAQLAELCAALKKRCGAGGAVKDGVIEIQGDHRDALFEEMVKRGYSVKRMGA